MCLEALWAAAIWLGLHPETVTVTERREFAACEVVNACSPEGDMNVCELRRVKPEQGTIHDCPRARYPDVCEEG